MKLIVALLTILIAIVVVFGTVIITLANSPNSQVVQVATPTPTQPPVPTATPTQEETQTPGRLIYSGNANQPRIALTFDDGPDPYYTAQVLSILQQYNVKATFFPIGQQVQQYPDLVQQEYAAGNLVGDHSWTHPDLTTLSDNDVRSQLSMTADAIQQATGVRPAFYRPPYGAVNNRVQAQATQLGFTAILWNVDTQDWQRPGQQAIINAVLNNVSNGSIILMHDGGGDRSQTVAALPTIIKQLAARGYGFETIQQLVDELPVASTAPTQVQASAFSSLSLVAASPDQIWDRRVA